MTHCPAAYGKKPRAFVVHNAAHVFVGSKHLSWRHPLYIVMEKSRIQHAQGFEKVSIGKRWQHTAADSFDDRAEEKCWRVGIHLFSGRACKPLFEYGGTELF